MRQARHSQAVRVRSKECADGDLTCTSGIEAWENSLQTFVACANRYSSNGCENLLGNIDGLLGLIDSSGAECEDTVTIYYKQPVDEYIQRYLCAISAKR